MNFSHILVPIDFSDNSLVALETGVSLAEQFGANLHLLHCYPCESPIMAPYAPAVPMGYLDTIRDAAAKHLREWSLKYCSKDISVTEHLSLHPPCEAITDLANELSADVIIMGTRGLTGLKHVFLGSVAERTVRMAPCPVLTVKEQ